MELHMAMTETIDRVVARMLWVTPAPPPTDDDLPADKPAQRAFSLSLVISGLRCTLQYMILPIVLPLIGFAGVVSLPLVILLDLVALWLLISSLRYFWRTAHPRRFDMLPLSGVILLLVLGSLGFDLWQLFVAA
jgi:hypothetical protein